MAFSEAGNVQPMPSPALTKMLGGEEFVHRFLERLVLVVDHVGNAEQIEM